MGRKRESGLRGTHGYVDGCRNSRQRYLRRRQTATSRPKETPPYAQGADSYENALKTCTTALPIVFTAAWERICPLIACAKSPNSFARPAPHAGARRGRQQHVEIECYLCDARRRRSCRISRVLRYLEAYPMNAFSGSLYCSDLNGYQGEGLG